MTKISIEDRVRKIFADHLNLDVETITADRRLDDLGGDSLDNIELTMALEEAFGIEIPDEDVESASTVGDVLAYLNKNATERAA